jgi:hypothetical protein
VCVSCCAENMLFLYTTPKITLNPTHGFSGRGLSSCWSVGG